MPADFSILCSASSELFAYPSPTIEKQEAKKERVATVILSTTLKHKVREKAKDRDKASSSTPGIAAEQVLECIQNELQDSGFHEGPARKPLYELHNPSRVTQIQVRSCAFDLKQRFVPVAATIKPSGIIMLADQEPSLPQRITKFHDSCQDQNEAVLPCPFEWPHIET